MAKELENLFDSKARPRILNFFFQNPEKDFGAKEISKKCNLNIRIAKKELEKFYKIKLLLRQKQKKQTIYNINSKFPYLLELKTLILSASPVSSKDVEEAFGKIPRIKLLLVSGIFMQENKSSTDVLIAGDNIPRSKVLNAIKKIESSTGREIQWTLMSQEEFNYRYQISDRFIKNIFGHRHKKIIDKLKLERD